jgi:hypothetical protein
MVYGATIRVEVYCTMKNVIVILLGLCAVCSIFSSSGVLSGHSLSISQMNKELSPGNDLQDGRLMKKLEWTSPNGELPGTYLEYAQSHPIVPARFIPVVDNAGLSYDENHTLSILVDADLYPSITNSVDQYLDDLLIEGYCVSLDTLSGGFPEEIKTWVLQQYDAGSRGVVFVGDITAAWAEIGDEVFPCDLFYMDLDGSWVDTNDDGVYDEHTAGDGDMDPEIYVGRIDAYTLDYDTEATMVNEYLEKVHAYRVGALVQPWRGLEYVEEDWYDMDVFLRDVYGAAVARFDSGFDTTAMDYLTQLSLGQHFVQVCAHSYSGGHHFGTRPTESAAYAHVYVYSPTTRLAQLKVGSNDGNKIWVNNVVVLENDRYGSWQKDRYNANISLIAGWNTLLCKISQKDSDYLFSVQLTDMDNQVFDDLIYQVNNPAYYPRESDYIRSWLLNGFHQDISDNFWEYLTTNYLGTDEATVNPSEGEEMGGHLWTEYDSGNPYINMGTYCNNADYGACYAFTRIYAEDVQPCQLWLGYDDGARIWLNGEEILYDNRYGGFEADMQKINITLQAGENRLLIKISEWMGDHGFSTRLSMPDGSPVDGLIYDPQPTPISYIGTWLINGPYYNQDRLTRLSTDYLGDEATITPSIGDSAPVGTWERGIGEGCPFNLGSFFDHGDWVFSSTIQEHDPPVLFYNLFSCGPGRFTDTDYLAGSYIFNTTYGLITVASAKSGSMLNFDDFYLPLSENNSIGQAFQHWFTAQAPYVAWEQEWYYGMVICGDPTLVVNPITHVKILQPENGIYLRNNKIIPFFASVVIGPCDITVGAFDNNGIDHVEFYIDGSLKATSSTPPYSWRWDEKTPFHWRYSVEVKAYDSLGNSNSDQRTIWKFR